jgi:hypothetical protein
MGPILFFEKVGNEYYDNMVLGGEQIACILEQANGVPVNKIIQKAYLEFMIKGKWTTDDFKRTPIQSTNAQQDYENSIREVSTDCL